MSAPRCPVSHDCRGCPLIELTAEQARAARVNRLYDALSQHLGDSVAKIPLDWVAVSQPGGYRRRIRLRIFNDNCVGFFNPAKYRGCVALTPALRQLLSDLVDTSQRHRDALRGLHHLELREPDLDQLASAYVVKHDPAQPLSPDHRERIHAWLEPYRYAIANEPQSVPCQRLALPSVWQYVPICSFLQVNQAINLALVLDLVTGAKQRNLSSFCDLYAGSGNFTLPLLAAGLAGWSVELDALAGSAARRAAREQTLPSGGFAVGDAGAFAAQAAASGRSFDLVVVDPPRAGVRQQLTAMASICRRNLVYCSCNQQSLGRDLGVLQKAHFELESLTVYDMFEHTEHIETLAWLRSPLPAEQRSTHLPT